MDESNAKPAEGFRFSLKGLPLFLAWFIVFCPLVVMHLGLGVLFLLLSLLVLAIVSRRWRCCAWSVIAALILLGFLLPIINAAREGARRAHCIGNLKQIALALKWHEQQHGSFPPAYIADENGKPMHSWRVLILPYMNHKSLYDAYRFDEPWDGPNNRKLADKCPEIFRCPSDAVTGSPAGNTSYVAVVGPHTAWTGDKGVKSEDITDGLSDTLLVVETANSGINWLEPRDLDMDQMARTINPKAGQGISSEHTGGANVAFADGSVRDLSEEISAEKLDALLTRDGGENVEPDQ